MLDVKIDGVAGFDQVGDSLRRSRKMFKSLLGNAAGDFANRAVTTVKRDYLSGGADHVAVQTGRLRSSIRYLLAEGESEITTTFGSDVPYAAAWEFGRKAGSFPPIAPLATWARRALGVPSKQARSVGFLIARAIARRGQKAKPFLEPGVRDEVPEFMQAIERLLSWDTILGTA